MALFRDTLIDTSNEHDQYDKMYRDRIAGLITCFTGTDLEAIEAFSVMNNDILDHTHINRIDLLEMLEHNKQVNDLIGDIAYNYRPYQGPLGWI